MASLSPARSASQGVQHVKFALVCVLTGLGAGIGGMLLALLLHLIQHLAYGYGLTADSRSMSFLSGVESASALRRVFALAVCGIVAGAGWFLVYRYGKPLVSVKKAVGTSDAVPPTPMPGIATTAHALLQIITVALGSPLGREVAPREIGSLWSGWLARIAGLDAAQSRLIVACGAGAGLAAVYNVPLGGAVFVLEVLLGTFAVRAVIPAIMTSVLAAVVARIGLGNETQYAVPAFAVDTNLVIWSVIAGPIFGACAHYFIVWTTKARQHAPKNWQLLPLCLANFVIIGALAITYPQILGNGKGPAALSFDGHITLVLAVTLLAIKLIITVSTLRAGAEGGLMTPGIATGALIAIILGVLWSMAFPGVALGAFALVGGAGFLASSMKMPISALVLVSEFTGVHQDFLVPMLFAIVGSVLVSRYLESRSA